MDAHDGDAQAARVFVLAHDRLLEHDRVAPVAQRHLRIRPDRDRLAAGRDGGHRGRIRRPLELRSGRRRGRGQRDLADLHLAAEEASRPPRSRSRPQSRSGRPRPARRSTSRPPRRRRRRRRSRRSRATLPAAPRPRPRSRRSRRRARATPAALLDPSAGSATGAADADGISAASRPTSARRRRVRMGQRVSPVSAGVGDTARMETTQPANRGAARRAAHLPAARGVPRACAHPRRAGVRGGRGRPRGVLARPRAEFVAWFEEPTQGLVWDPPHCTWFADGVLNVAWNCLDRTSRQAGGTRSRTTGSGRARGDPRPHVRRPPRGGLAARERAPAAGHRQGRPGRHLHGHGPRAADRHARVRADRRAAHRRVRRLLRRLARGAAARLRREGPDHAGRGLAQGRQGAAEGERGRGARAGALGGAVDRAPPDGRPRSTGRRPRHLVARRCRRRVRRVRARADGRRGHALPAPHLGLDREAEGRAAHERRLPDARLGDAQVDLRHPRGHGLVVRGRRRLGHRPQLHRLRAAEQRRPRPSSTRAIRPTRTGTATGRSSSATRSTRTTRRRRSSARS